MDKELIEYLERRFDAIDIDLKIIKEMLYSKLKIKEIINTRVNKQYEVMQIEGILETPEGIIIRVR